MTSADPDHDYKIVPFPILRRAGFVTRQAAYIATLKQSKRGANIERMVQVQIDAMRRRGVDESLIEQEISVFRVAMAVELEQVLRQYDGGAA
jgi:hypothetical protein